MSIRWWWTDCPVPGYAVAALGVAAIIMSLRGTSFTRIEQVTWVAIAFFLFIIEIRAIDQDRAFADAQHLSDIRKILGNFRDVQRDQADLKARNEQLKLDMKLKAPFDKPWDVVEVIVPQLPPSVNHYVKHTRNGIHYVTKEAKDFFKAVGLAAKGEYVRGDTYTVEIYINLMPGERGDLDNFAKVCIDGLVKSNVIDSDSKVTMLVMHKKRWTSYIPQTQMTVWTNK